MEDAQLKYERQAVKNASNTELISKLYEFIVKACHKQNEEKVYEILSTLKKSLNFDFEISEDLYSLYDYCQRKAREQKFDEVRELIEPLREAWVEGVVKSNKKTATTKSSGFLV